MRVRAFIRNFPTLIGRIEFGSKINPSVIAQMSGYCKEMWKWLTSTRQRRDSDARDTDERLRDLERDMKAIRLEWSETFESLDRTARKLAKREKRAMQGEGDHPEVKEESPPPATPQFNGKDELRRWARANGHL